MKEHIAGRVSRIVSGSLNALVDAVEGAAPETVMEQAIREIDGAIFEVRGELGTVVANKHLAAKRLADEQQRHESLTGRIEIAVQSDRDDLAEVAIASQLDIEAQIPVLEETIARLSEQERELEAYVNALNARKREMREELQQFLTSRELPVGDARGCTNQVEATADKAQATFDRVLEKSTGILGASATQPRDAAKLAELEELARSNRIRERLESVKSTSRTN